MYFELKGGRKKQGTYTYTSTECISFRYLHVMCLNESNDDNDHYTQKANLSSLIHTLGRVLLNRNFESKEANVAVTDANYLKQILPKSLHSGIENPSFWSSFPKLRCKMTEKQTFVP